MKSPYSKGKSSTYLRVPITRRVLSDLDTPLSIYTKLALGKNSFLLESVEGGEKWGRYSIIGLPSPRHLTVNGLDITLWHKGKKIEHHTLVVKPNFGCSTKYIYSKVKKFTKSQFNHPKQSMFKTDYLKNLNNDLEKIAFNKFPTLKKIKSFLLTTPNNIFVRMSGSGSSIVAYFHSKKACSKAYRQFKGNFNDHWCIISKTI